MPITPNCNNYCTDELEYHTPNNCDYILGSLSGTVILFCDHQLVDASNGVLIQAEVDANRARIIKDVKLSIDPASPIKVDSPVGGAPQILVNYDRKGTYVDGNVNPDNIAFYNKLFGGYKIGGAIVYEKGSEQSQGGAQVTWIDEVITFTGSRIIPVSDGEVQTFTGEWNWRSKNNGDIYPAPVGIF